LEISNPTRMPPAQEIAAIEEPIVTALIITPPEFLGPLFKLAEERRGTQKELKYLSPKRVLLTYELPLNEIVLDFHDRLKSLSRGYASLDYHVNSYPESDLVNLDILLTGDPVDAL